jgi:hypothetical protein
MLCYPYVDAREVYVKAIGRKNFMAYDPEVIDDRKLRAVMRMCDQEEEVTVTSIVGPIAKNTLEAHMLISVLFAAEKLYPLGKSVFVSHGKRMPVVVWRRRKSKIQVRSAKGLAHNKTLHKGYKDTSKVESDVERPGEPLKVDFSREP